MAESKIAIYGAIAANVPIAAIKFIVAGITGSSAMLSEGIHSTVDSGNGVLLLVGVRPSKRKPTLEDRPRGRIRSGRSRQRGSGRRSQTRVQDPWTVSAHQEHLHRAAAGLGRSSGECGIPYRQSIEV
jgi:hypothetical protein